MEIRSLQIFLAVAREGSVSKAAKALHYVQSNVTARIKQLEDTLGAALFVRKSRGMALTAEGKVLLKYAERILHLAEQATKAVNASLVSGGELTIGSMETFAAIHLPQILSQFHKKHPGINLSLRTGTSEEMTRKVLEFQVDCAFVGGEVNHAEINRLVVFKEKLFLFSRNAERFESEKEVLTLLVFRTGCAYRAHLEQWLFQSGIRNYRTMEFSTLDAILGCVDAGMGVTILPGSLLERPQYNHFAVKELPEEFGTINMNLIYHKNTVFTHSMKSFLDQIGDQS